MDRPEDEFDWHQILFKLGMAGLKPIPSVIETIRIEGNVIKVFTENYRMIKLLFEELYVYDFERVEGLPVEERVNEYLVYDWFNVRRGSQQPTTRVKTEDKLVNEINLYKSIRYDSDLGRIDICVKSFIALENLNDFDYSETTVRLITSKLLKENGIKTVWKRTKGGYQNIYLVLEHDRRELYKHKKEFILNEELPSNVFCCNITK